MGPAGVGKSFFAQALGYAAIRAGHTVRFSHADDFFKAMAQARVDNSVDRTFRSFLSPGLLILDDLGLHGLTAQQSADLYELIPQSASGVQLHHHQQPGPWTNGWVSSMTPSWATAPWIGWPTPATRSSSKAPATGNGLSPHRALLGAKGVIDPQTTT